jgi:hypothetical protein
MEVRFENLDLTRTIALDFLKKEYKLSLNIQFHIIPINVSAEINTRLDGHTITQLSNN